MTVHITEGVWLDTIETCSLHDIVEASGLAQELVQDLIETGVIKPSRKEGRTQFHISCITVARTARRLRDDFELDAPGLALAMRLLARIDELEAELDRSRKKPRF